MPNQANDTHQKVSLGRLKKRPEFLAVNAAQKKWVSDSVVVQYQPVDTDFKFGVTATKKIGNAVIRNRCKRRLRSAINDIAKNSDLKPANIVLVARHSTPTCEWDKLSGDLKWCLKRLEILNV